MKEGSEMKKEIYPDDNLKKILPMLYVITILVFSSVTYVFYLSENILTISISAVVTVFLLIFIPLYSVSLWNKTRPYVITERWVEIPSGYTPSGNKEKVKFEEIEKIYHRKSGRFKDSLILKTNFAEYIIREDLKREILRSSPSSLMEKLDGEIDG